MTAALILLSAGPAHGATFTVASTADLQDSSPGNGVCATGAIAPGPCTLRAAVEEAGGFVGDDTIIVPAGTYQLTGAADEDAGVTGDLDFQSEGTPPESTTLVGAGARVTRIVGTGGDRVLHATQSNDTVSISGVTITGGAGVGQGGGILADGTFNLTNAAVVGNRADDPDFISNQGGGIFNSVRMNLNGVTISGNVAARGPTSSFGPQGGGLFDNGVPTSTLTNVTITGNQATGAGSQGGGLFYNADALATTLRNVTLAANSVPAGEDGGGLFANDDITAVNTIIANNLAGGAASQCSGGTAIHSSGRNLTGPGASGAACNFTAAGDLNGANTLLGSLANNGGQTDTMALLAGSPAIDAAAACPATDQRGVARPQGSACDIGAFEAAPAAAQPQGLPAPVVGRTFNVVRLSGKVLVASGNGPQLSRAGAAQKGRRFVPLTSPRQLRVGSFLNTRKGKVRITTAVNAKGKLQSGDFAAGLFQVLQSRKKRAKGLTELRLKGSSFKRCTARRRGKRSQAGASRLSRRAIRRLRAKAKGRFRTRGRYSAATVRGTTWTTTDRCDGTLTKVTRGKVAVRDFKRKRTITLRRGKSYLARARR